jgi:hypothetical protein
MKQDKHYVVQTKSGKSFSSGKRAANTRIKVVDKRMKKEMRSKGVAGKGKNKRGGKTRKDRPQKGGSKRKMQQTKNGKGR